MKSHLEVRSAYQAWCAANPTLPMDQFPDYSRLVEVADLEPVDTVSTSVEPTLTSRFSSSIVGTSTQLHT